MILGVGSEFLPKSRDLAERGKAWLRFESSPVNGFTGRPVSAVKMGAISM
jgi:hypothetical protein